MRKVLFLDNVLLALSRKTSRRNARRGASWGTSTVSTTTNDTSTVDLLPHHSHSHNISRSPSLPAPVSRITTTAHPSPSLSQPQTTNQQPRRNEEAPEASGSGTRHNIVDFAYHTPSHSHSHSSPEVGQIGLALSPPLPERNPSRSQVKKGKEKVRSRGYESVNWSDEQTSDAEDTLRRVRRARTS